MGVTEDKLDLILREVTGMRGELTEVKDDVRSLKSDVQTLKGDVQTLKGDVQVLKSDVQVLKDDVQVLKSDMVKVHTRLDSHEGMLVQLIGIVKSTNEKLSFVMERQNEQGFAIQVLNREQFQLKADVEMLKNR